MSNISGVASYRLSYTDSTAVDAKSISHQISLAEEVRTSSGKVAVISGTVGTSAISVTLEPTTYVNSSNEFVAFSGSSPPTRLALQASGPALVQLNDADLSVISIFSRNNVIATTVWGGGSTVESGLVVSASGGTNTYTIFILSDE